MKPGSPARRIEVGDFTYCRSAYHRDQLDIPTDAGLVLEVKRNHYRLLYGGNRCFWLPGHTLARLDGDVNTRTLAGRLHWIIKRFGAHDCELRVDDGLCQATMRVTAIDDRSVDALRALLGADFLGLSLAPEGMAFMLAEVRFRR